MKFVKNFISFVSVASLFWMMSCSSSLGDSTDISISFNVNALKNKTAKVMQNAGSISDGEGEFVASDELYNAKLSVTLYEVKNAENIPSDYESFDKSLYKEISFSSCYADESGNMTVTLSAVPIGMKAIIVAEITAENENVQEVMFAGISKVFEVLPEKNIIDLELESCVIDEPVFTLEYKTQTEIVISTQKNIKAGTSIPLPQNINLDELGIKGFRNFLGFYTDSLFTGNPITSVVVDKDITLYAKFEIIYYSITYDIDGATWNNYTPNSSYNVLDAAISYIPKGEDLEKVGYTFEGWYKDADYKEKFTSFVGLFEDITLYAKWEAINYSIGYVLNGGTWEDIYRPFTDYTVKGITYLPSGNNLIREGFVFDGWYDNPEYTGTAIDSLVGRTGDLTVYAKWRDENQVATVQFSHAAGGVDASTNIILTCDTDNATIYYSYEGKEFSDNGQQDSWFKYTSDATATSEGITIFANGSTNSNPVTIYAIAVCDGMENSDVATIEYTLNEYTINLDANGGTLGISVTSPIIVKSGDTVSLLGYTATRIGYTFKGWYEDTNPDFATSGEVREFIPSRDNAPNKTKTFYAGWNPISYTVVFDGNSADASSMDPQEFKYDESKALNQNTIVRTGYTFTGWNTNADGTGTTYADKAVVSNLTYTDGERFILYAQWQPNTASITVTLPTYTDISGLSNPTTNGNNVVFTASGYDSYAWYVNGDKQTATSSSFTFNTSSEAGGIYTIMLVVVDSNGNKYSAEYQVTVTK